MGLSRRKGYCMRRQRRPYPPDTHQPRGTGRGRKVAPHRSPRAGEVRPSGDGAVILYGWHTVKAALENPARRIRRLYATANAARRLAEDGVALAVEPELVRPDAIAQRLGPDAVHNGLLAEADPLPSPELEEIEPAGIVLVLDQITDPHNLPPGGAARSAGPHQEPQRLQRRGAGALRRDQADGLTRAAQAVARPARRLMKSSSTRAVRHAPTHGYAHSVARKNAVPSRKSN